MDGERRFLGLGRGSSRARRWTERKEEGEDATPAREEPPRSRSWQVASSPVVTALKPHSKPSCRPIFASPEIDMPGSCLQGKQFIYLFSLSRLFIDSCCLFFLSFFFSTSDD